MQCSLLSVIMQCVVCMVYCRLHCAESSVKYSVCSGVGQIVELAFNSV